MLFRSVENATALNKYFSFLKSGFNTNGRGLSDFETGQLRSEERRVGKECRTRWSPYHKKKKKKRKQ